MLFHIIIGFIFPWIVGGYLLRNHTSLFTIFYPSTTATSFFINEIGFNYFWKMSINEWNVNWSGFSYLTRYSIVFITN
ncbi:hypothetical protein SRABI96_05105 [Peribacillus sp. Bi96]|nr:hypothetical protein SRABI96_05105 [Peribacillus sp. Bi96]